MGEIFISYRRRGTHAVTVGALADRLEHYFGSDQVFYDTRLTPGKRYPDELRQRLLDSAVLVAVIHDDWVDEFARPRDDEDWVRDEIATALKKGIPVVPVLLEQVEPPLRRQLPDDLGEVAVLQAARVRGATFPADVKDLVRLLERHVAPVDVPAPEPATPAKPKRVGRRIIAWASVLFLVSPILFFFDSARQDWEWFAFAAFGSTAILAGISLLTMILVPVKRLTYRWDVEAGAMSLREATKRWWLVLALAILPFVYMLSKFGTREDGVWQEWEVWYLIVIGVVALFFMHRSWRRYDARDYTWPPPVSTEPAVFRRAAHRLHEKLTTDPGWRGSRPRASQREAVSVYLSLAKVRLELRTRATISLSRWIKAGHSGEITAYLGWLASIVALDAVALALLDFGTVGAYRFITVTVAAAVAFTAAKTVTEFYSDRKEAARWVHELTEWQAKLGPLIFCEPLGRTR